MKLSEIPSRVHFVGVGGIGMSGLAEYLARLGHIVTGSDRQANDRTQALSDGGITVYIGHSGANVGKAELVVRTSAVPVDNAEIVSAAIRGIPIVLREELLGAVFNSFPTRIAVCGTHGKTTVTAMIHELLSHCGVDHAAFIGGVYHGRNMYFGQNVAVAEACEYNRSFLNLKPTVTVCTNVEYDHPDCYKDKQDVLRAFADFISNTSGNGAVILPECLANICQGKRSIFYDKSFSYDERIVDGKSVLTITQDGRQTELFLNVVGRHNARNALIALSVGKYMGLDLNRCADALSRFDGVDRRWTEHVGCCRIVCDYAHHPTEISCSVDTAKSLSKGKVLCIFQPHTYTRTKAFFGEFVRCFANADKVAYLPVYSAREKPLDGVTSQELAKYALTQGVNAYHLTDFEEARKWALNNARKDDVLLILGAGDVAELSTML